MNEEQIIIDIIIENINSGHIDFDNEGVPFKLKYLTSGEAISSQILDRLNNRKGFIQSEIVNSAIEKVKLIYNTKLYKVLT